MLTETLQEENQRLRQAIRIAINELERHFDPNKILGDLNDGPKYALSVLESCVSPENPKEAERWEEYCGKPDRMSPEKLADTFSSTYKVHSNPSIYLRLKAGHDEILSRLKRLERMEAPNVNATTEANPNAG